jgi:hypothetical protein
MPDPGIRILITVNTDPQPSTLTFSDVLRPGFGQMSVRSANIRCFPEADILCSKVEFLAVFITTWKILFRNDSNEQKTHNTLRAAAGMRRLDETYR